MPARNIKSYLAVLLYQPVESVLSIRISLAASRPGALEEKRSNHVRERVRSAREGLRRLLADCSIACKGIR